MTRKYIDANIILRLLVTDGGVLFEKAKEIFKDAEKGKFKLIIESLILGEVVWTLKSYCGFDRSIIATRLIDLISQDFVNCDDKNRLLKALNYFEKENLGFADCWLMAGTEDTGNELLTFDKSLEKLVSKKVRQ
jgi:predicted nucleic-acid-binding protein